MAANMAIFNILLTAPSRWINGNYDLLAAGIAGIGRFLVHRSNSNVRQVPLHHRTDFSFASRMSPCTLIRDVHSYLTFSISSTHVLRLWVLLPEIVGTEAYHPSIRDKIEEEVGVQDSNQFSNSENKKAFRWLTISGSIQAAQLEHAMRNYEHPVYDPADVGQHLLRALSLPMAGFTGDASKVDVLPLALAVISHGMDMGWDVVKEVGRV